MSSDSATSVLVVDDDLLFREAAVALLRDAGFRTLAVPSGEEALAAAAREERVVLLLDIHLPGLSGYEVCQRLREHHHGHVGIVFVSGVRTEPYDRAAGLLVGGDDYVVKPFDPGELIARVRRLARAAPNQGPRDGIDENDLTRREHEVLTLLAEGRTQAEIAELLVITPKTVGTHIQRVLSKLGVHSRAQAVALAHRRQLVDM
jgi:DNA-binding NarL/FixJ family response regulator